MIFLISRNIFSAYYGRDTIVKYSQTESNNQKMDLHLKLIQSEQGGLGGGAEQCIENVVNAVRKLHKSNSKSELWEIFPDYRDYELSHERRIKTSEVTKFG